MIKREALVLLVAFALSVAVRIPLLDRPLSAHHEYCTAFTLIALTNWYEDGFASHHGVPSGGYVREGEKLLPKDRFDRNERAVTLYYFSHPPLAYDLPYALFRIVGSPPNVIGLQVFNLFFHLVSMVALFFAVRWGWPDAKPSAALFAGVLYGSLPATLWFHGNVYMSDLFVQVPWLVHLAVAVRMFRSPHRIISRDLLLFGFTLFLTVYTSWLGVFAGAAAVLFALFRWVRDRQRRFVPVLLVTGAAIVLALGLTAWRSLQVIDAHALMDHMASRFAVRSSFHVQNIGLHLRQLAENYRTGFLPIAMLLALLVVLWFRTRGNTSVSSSDGRTFLVLSGLPVLLDHLFLLQYADHDFAALKAAPFLCGATGVLLTRWSPRLAWWAVGITCLLGVLYFYRLNPLPGMDNGRYVQEQELGHSIAAHAAPYEVVFAIGLSTEPQVAWYAKRNVIGIGSVADARHFLVERGADRGVVFQNRADTIVIERIQR